MAEGNLLCLRWNNHLSNFRFTLGQLQQKDLYSDATIACDDRFYPVHKFVLSTCSDYFANMFERTPCKHPVIVLKDVSSRDTEFLLSYMYGGEVSVSQADLPSLIRAAETLHIKGLAAHDDPPCSPRQSSKSVRSERDAEDTPSKKSRMDENVTLSSEDCSQATVKTEVDDDYVSIPEDDNNDKNEPSDSQMPYVDSNLCENSLRETNFYEGGTFPVPLQELSTQVKEEEISIVESTNTKENTGHTAPHSNSDSVDYDNTSTFVPCSTLPAAAGFSHRSNPLYSSRQPSSESGDDCQTVDSNRTGLNFHTTGQKFPGPGSVTNPNSLLTSPVTVTATGPLAPGPIATGPLATGPTAAPFSNLQPQEHHTFRCPMCDYITHNRSWLYIHLRKHTGEKPFSCPYCSFRSAQRGNLNVHIKKLHASIPTSNFYKSCLSGHASSGLLGNQGVAGGGAMGVVSSAAVMSSNSLVLKSEDK